jgi:subtilase family serine protease
MKGLLNPPGRKFPARFFGVAINWRPVTAAMFWAAASLGLAPQAALAQSNATVALSPMVAESTLLSNMDPNQEIVIQLSLPLSNPQSAREFVQHVSTPKDPLFHHFITVQEFAARFGANAEDFAAVKAWATANGLSIQHEASARTSLTVSGSVAQLQELFKTQLSNYRSPKGEQFYSASVEPTIPSEIVSKLRGVVGLTESVRIAKLSKIGKVLGEDTAARTDTAGGSGVNGTYAPDDLKIAYRIPDLGGLVPQTVAVFEQGGIEQSDVTTFLKRFNLPEVPIKVEPVDGTSTKPFLGPNGTIDEVDLDIDTIIGMNPSVKEILVFDADPDTVPFSVGLVDTFDAVASSAAQTLSVSYGIDEKTQGATAIANEGDALMECVSAGVTVVVSAGDDGAYGRTGTRTDPATLNAPDPGSQPLITSVGGTTLFTAQKEAYLGEEVWNDLGIGDGATGGGVSSFNPIPAYQNPAVVTANGGSATMRNVPDVGALGDPLTGFGIFVKSDGGWLQIGGTSLSAPIWGGYLSIVNSTMQFLTDTTTPGVGFFNPTLYTANATLAPAGFLNPIEDGSNGNLDLFGTAGFNAGVGYNNCTGLGTVLGPFAYEIALVSGTGSDAPSAPTNLKVTPAATSAKITWTKSPGATGYVVLVDFLERSNGSFLATAIEQIAVTHSDKVTVTGLTAGSEYGVAVEAVNSGGANEVESSFMTKK